MKKIFPPLLPGFELATFRSPVRAVNQQAIPAPALYQEAILIYILQSLHSITNTHEGPCSELWPLVSSFRGDLNFDAPACFLATGSSYKRQTGQIDEGSKNWPAQCCLDGTLTQSGTVAWLILSSVGRINACTLDPASVRIQQGNELTRKERSSTVVSTRLATLE